MNVCFSPLGAEASQSPHLARQRDVSVPRMRGIPPPTRRGFSTGPLKGISITARQTALIIQHTDMHCNHLEIYSTNQATQEIECKHANTHSECAPLEEI